MSEQDKRLHQIKMCDKILTGFVIALIVSLAAEWLLVSIVQDALWVRQLLKLLGAIVLICPFGIMIPLFFRVNFKSRLIMLQREENSLHGSHNNKNQGNNDQKDGKKE